MTLPAEHRASDPACTTQCPLCGCRFEEGRPACGACPLHSHCGGECCPRCGYVLAGRPASVDWIHRAARSLRRLFFPRNTKGDRP